MYDCAQVLINWSKFVVWSIKNPSQVQASSKACLSRLKKRIQFFCVDIIATRNKLDNARIQITQFTINVKHRAKKEVIQQHSKQSQHPCFINLVWKNNNNDISSIISHDEIEGKLNVCKPKLYLKSKMTIFDKPHLRIKSKRKKIQSSSKTLAQSKYILLLIN